MGTSVIFDYLSIAKKKSIFKTLRDAVHPEISTFAKHLKFFKFLYLQDIKDENSKNE